MNLMGHYAAANHALIHKHIGKKLGASVILDIENHHNFAWKERHVVNGEKREVIVHRKDDARRRRRARGFAARWRRLVTWSAARVRPSPLHSASHGAGRVISRTKAMQSFTWSATKKLLAERGVELLSAGLDEVPGLQGHPRRHGRADRSGRSPRPVGSEARKDVPSRRPCRSLNGLALVNGDL
jgi:tRNA-splicing ligase RtcB